MIVKPAWNNLYVFLYLLFYFAMINTNKKLIFFFYKVKFRHIYVIHGAEGGEL